MFARVAHRDQTDGPAGDAAYGPELASVTPRAPTTPHACQSLGDLRGWLLGFARGLGFYGGRYIHIGHAALAGPAAANRPRRFLSTSYREADDVAGDWLDSDPSASLIMTAYAPFPWSTSIDSRVRDRHRDWLAEQRAVGVSAGIAIPVQDYPGGPAYISLFGIDEDRAARLSSERAAELSFAASTFHAAAKSILTADDGAAPGAAMTGRELDVLRLAALGMTVPESARALGIHFRTVEYHLKGASEKLGANSKLRAVAVAVRRGLIDV